MPDHHHYQVPLTNQWLTYPTPSPVVSPPLSVHGELFARHYQSLNWAQFFVHDAQTMGDLSNQQPIVPWVWWHNHPSFIGSIDFAFAGATSQHNCRDFEYQHKNKSCSTRSIYRAQQPYRKAGFAHHRNLINPITLVQVPGVRKQVDMFINAVKQHPLLATDKTLYIIFVGGNDLNLDLLNLSKKHYIAAFAPLLHGSEHNVYLAIRNLEKHAHARHILIMSLFDMRETPYLHTNIVKLDHLKPKQEKNLLKLTNIAVTLYNHELRHMVNRINFFQHKILRHPIDITYFDTYQTLHAMTKSPIFNHPSTRYQMCLRTVGMPSSYFSQRNTCTKDGKKYLFWNGAHPSVYVGEYIGYRLLQQLMATHQPKQLKS